MEKFNLHNWMFADGKIFPWPRPIQAVLNSLRVIVNGTDGTPVSQASIEKPSTQAKNIPSK